MKKISEKIFADIKSFIDQYFVEEQFSVYPADRSICASQCIEEKVMSVSRGVDVSLKEIIEQMDESFTEMLLRKIDEKDMKDSDCYKKANIDRKLFSKIRSNIHYRPSKPTAIALAIALELSLEETNEMLKKAGFTLSHSSKFDVIIEYFIKNGNYNVIEINEALYAFDQVLLGA